jgi:HlyD family secretion protein
MQFFSSSAPAPGGGAEANVPMSVPGPAAVPPHEPEKPKTLIWVVVAVVAVLAGAAWYWKASSDAAAKAAAVVIPTITVSEADVSATVRVSGTIAATDYSALMAPRFQGSRSDLNRGGAGSNRDMQAAVGGGGSIGRDFAMTLLTLASAGKVVQVGEVVATFDPQFQQQRLDDYKDTVIQQEARIRQQMANLASVKEQQDQSERSAKAAWEKALLNLQTAPIRSTIDAEKYKLAAEESELKYKEEQKQTALLVQIQESQVKGYQLTRDQSRLELQRSEKNVKMMSVKAPISGVVVLESTVRNGEYAQFREGDNVNAGQTYMKIVNPGKMILNASVNQVDGDKLKLGLKGTIRMDAYSDIAVPGTLEGLGAMSKSSTFRAGYVGEIPLRLHLDGMDERIIPDLTASAEIVTATEKSALVVPLNAVFAEKDAQYVYRKTAQGWDKVKIEPGLASNVNVAVKSGLRKGDVVALQKPM